MADTVTVYQGPAGAWYWHRQAANGEIISESGESYTRHSDAWRAADRANDDGVTIVTGEAR